MVGEKVQGLLIKHRVSLQELTNREQAYVQLLVFSWLFCASRKGSGRAVPAAGPRSAGIRSWAHETPEAPCFQVNGPFLPTTTRVSPSPPAGSLLSCLTSPYFYPCSAGCRPNTFSFSTAKQRSALKTLCSLPIPGVCLSLVVWLALAGRAKLRCADLTALRWRWKGWRCGWRREEANLPCASATGRDESLVTAGSPGGVNPAQEPAQRLAEFTSCFWWAWGTICERSWGRCCCCGNPCQRFACVQQQLKSHEYHWCSVGLKLGQNLTLQTKYC